MKRFEREDGFTLIEILVVILIIGILAAIAIPVFLNQRKTANDAVVESDGRNVATAVETYISDNPDATTIPIAEIRKLVKESEGVSIIVMGSPNDFCVHGSHVNAKQYKNDNDWTNGRPYYVYSSLMGGEVSQQEYWGGISGLSCYHSMAGL